MNIPELERVFILKIAVKHDRGVWLKIAIRSGQPLNELHRMIQEQFAYDSGDRYAFKIPPEGRSGRARQWLAAYYTPGAESRFTARLNIIPGDAAKIPVNALGKKSRTRFAYLAGHAEDPMFWREHIVYVEEDAAEDEGHPYPMVVDRAGFPEPLM